MLKMSLCTLATIAMFAMGFAQPVAAQAANPTYPSRAAPGSAGADPHPVPVRSRTWGTRLGSNPPAQSREMMVAAAQALARATDIDCRVSQATRIGSSANRKSVYEAVCIDGPGYILIDETPPQALNCLAVAGQAEQDRARDPNANIGAQCETTANLDFAKVVSRYAEAANIDCSVDQGAWIGRSVGGNPIYEVGCAGTDGFWIEETPNGWVSTPCLRVPSESSACKFSQRSEQAAAVQAMLSGTTGGSCQVTDARYMGANTNGHFYEARCATGEGFVAQLGSGGEVQELTPCINAAALGGGCRLTTSSPRGG